MTDEGWEPKVWERAHAIWEREGRPEGDSARHWAAAEAELRAEAPEPPPSGDGAKAPGVKAPKVAGPEKAAPAAAGGVLP